MSVPATARPSPRRSWSGRRRRHARHGLDLLHEARLQRGHAAAADRVGDEQLRLQVGRQHVADALLEAGGEHRHEADQEDADHQRSGGDGGAGRVTLRVLTARCDRECRPRLHAGVADRAGQLPGRRRAPSGRRRGSSSNAPAPSEMSTGRRAVGERTGRSRRITRPRDGHDRRDDLALAGPASRAAAARPRGWAATGGILGRTAAPGRTRRSASRRCRSQHRHDDRADPEAEAAGRAGPKPIASNSRAISFATAEAPRRCRPPTRSRRPATPRPSRS